MPRKHAKLRKMVFALALSGLIQPGFAATITTSDGNHSSVAHSSSHRNTKTTLHRTTQHTAAIKKATTTHAKSTSTTKPSNVAKPSTHATTTTHSTRLVTAHKAKTHTQTKPTTHAATHTVTHTTNHTHTSGHHTNIPAHHTVQPVHPVIEPVKPTVPDIKAADTIASDDSTQDTTAKSGVGQRLVGFIHRFMSSLHYTRYRSGGQVFDDTHGIYELDCSHYVDNVLQKSCPGAYSSLEASTGSRAPDSENYYQFFSHLSPNLSGPWDRVENAKDLEPGDVLVFRYTSSSGAAYGGHVMVVMDKPVPDKDALLVRVSDSANAGHSDDTRPLHDSGVGIGTLLLKVDQATGQPFAYAWQLDAPWQSRVDIAMGRPDIG